MPLPTTPRELAATYNDILATAGAIIERMHSQGHINERWQHMLLAQLNATLYTLGYALPPGAIITQNVDTGEKRQCTKVEEDAPKVATTNRKTKG